MANGLKGRLARFAPVFTDFAPLLDQKDPLCFSPIKADSLFRPFGRILPFVDKNFFSLAPEPRFLV